MEERGDKMGVVEERETINKASHRNVKEGGGRWGRERERKEGWESSDLTDLREMGQEDRQAGRQTYGRSLCLLVSALSIC